MRRARRFGTCFAGAAALLVACSGGSTGTDAPLDAGTVLDASTSDARPVDSRAPDAAIDASTPDTSIADAAIDAPLPSHCTTATHSPMSHDPTIAALAAAVGAFRSSLGGQVFAEASFCLDDDEL